MTISEWIKRRWFDLRNGYSFYFSIVLAFINFILIISVKFPGFDIFLFALGIGFLVAGAATFVGYLHRKHQLGTDQDSNFEHSRLAARVWELAINVSLGKADPKEVDKVIRILQDIKEGRY